MSRRPHDLSDHLRVPRDADDSRLPEVDLRLSTAATSFKLNTEGYRKKNERKLMVQASPWTHADGLAVPELDAVMGMANKIDDPQ